MTIIHSIVSGMQKENPMKKLKITKTTLVLYVISVVLLLYATFELFNAITYIMDYMSAGSISFSDDLNTIISFITDACLDYYLKAIIFYIMAKSYQILVNLKKEATTPIEV